MTTSVYNKYSNSVGTMTQADNIGSDVFKVALAATVNPADTTFVAGTTDLATGNGYTAGGNISSTVSASVSAGTQTLILNSPSQWTASGAGFTFRYAVLYNSTTGSLYGYWDYGSSQVVTAGEHVTVTLDATNGVFKVS